MPTGDNRPKNPMKATIPWGRGSSTYRPGLFVKQYFLTNQEVCCADAFRALKDDLERMNQERVEIGELPIRGGTYNSFAKYWHWFAILGLIERTDKREAAIYDFLQKKVFYTLTEKGKVEVRAWEDPVRAVHPEFAS